METWLMAVAHVGRHARSWTYIQGSTCNQQNEGKSNDLRCMLYSVYAVLSVCCTRCMLCSVYAALGVCCTRHILYWVYALVGVNLWLWHGEIERDDLTLCSAMILELWMRRREKGDEDKHDVEDYEQIWEIRGTTCMVTLRRPPLGVITRRIGTRTCCIGDGKLTCTQNSLKSQFLMMISPLPIYLLSILSSILPSPENTKLRHRSLSLHATIKS